jgi:flagellar secretion chaperone FliS
MARFLKQAEIAAGEGDWGRSSERMTRADAILDELLLTLDLEAGGEIATRLQSIYVFCKRLLIDARVEHSTAPILEAAGLLADLREAWAEAAAA